ncbi:MAG: M60 family metallopeptidase [Clostridia bacterium]|nr:M60 family metallopeptidase [Clostridia bacterium]
MKLTVKHWLIAFLSAVFLAAAIWAVAPVTSASADTGNITCETASGNYLNDDYLAVYRVPANLMTYEANGGASGGNTLANAFDGNWNTFWQTATENNGQGSENPAFLNAITVTFSKAVTIESIVYASSSARLGHGYPITLNVYTANGGALALYGTCNSSATDDRVVFSLNKAVTVTQVKFEFRKVNTMHNWTATAKEIQFLQPDNANANKVLDLFDDYAQCSVKNQYKADLSQIRSGVTGLLSYENALKPLLDRAELIVSGQLKKDSRREFSTDPNAANVINRYGDLRSYAGNTLKMSSFGINRQVLGVGGLKGQTITIYVEAEAGDPLPTIAFTQVKGDWRSWQSTYRLSLGKNVLTFPDFITDNYSWNVTPGGPIHIINPYEPSQQSSKVKVYVEGGYLYPVFRKGGDENAFLQELTSYNEKLQSTEGMSDVAELVGDHFLHTVSAKRAYNDFVTRKVSPQKNAERWDDYISALLEFDGISLSSDGEHFNEKNLHLYTNFRVVQPWGGAGAFAAGDHIGFISFGEDGMTNFGVPGWGVAHEIGHALDVNGRTIGETTNNMWAKYELAYLSHNVSRNFNDEMTRVLTPDETALSAGYFNTNTYSYQIWWNLEACYHGFWGKLDNMYRYFDEAAARNKAGVTAEDGQLSTTERMVYYSSLVVGEDLGYYYERYGFSFSTGDNYAPFREETASAAYKKLIKKALDDKQIVYRGFKYWYIDANQYFYEFTGNADYSPTSSVEIREVWKTDAGYMLILPEPAEGSAHLGYEIMEYRNGNWYVIGFTYSGSYIDTTAYNEGYAPQYKIRAYDREMSASKESAAVTFKEISQSRTCRIGDVYYNSISEAVAAANANDTIYICADLYDGAITINKNLTILPDPSVKGSVVITKCLIGVMFTVNGGVTFTLGDNDGAKIVLDGNSFSQNGALIKVNGGTLRVNNAELRNNRNTDHGGAVFNTGNSTFTNVTMKNNVTSINGGAIANFSGGIITLTDCTLSGNVAKGNGGALTLDGKTTLTRVTVTGNSASNIGGAMYMLCGNDARSVYIEGGVIRGNTAGKGGSAIYLDKGILTLVGGDTGVKISGDIYKNSGSININTATPDFSEVIFRTPSVSAETVLLTATGNLTFAEAFAKGLKVELAGVRLGEGNKTVLFKSWPTVTYSVNGSEGTVQVTPRSYILPDTVNVLDGKQYVASWEIDGKSYAVGAKVEITDNCSIKAVIGNKFTVTLKYDGNKTATQYVKPNESIVLEECSAPEGKVFSHWDVNGTNYKAGDSVRITKDTVITAVFEDAAPVNPGCFGSIGGVGMTSGFTFLAVALLMAVTKVAKRKRNA